MSATMGSETRSGIGARLKASRERMGMTLLQVAEKLHVDPKVLEAVEAERFEELGAPVYTKGHLKRYAELTGDDAAQILDLYSAGRKVVLPDLTQLPKVSTHHTDPRKLVLPSLVVLIAFALIGSVWWVLQNIGAAPPAPPQEESPAESVAPTEVPAESSPADTGNAATPPAGQGAQASNPPPPTPATQGNRAPAATTQGRSAPASASSTPAASAASTTSDTRTVNRLRGSGTRAGTTAGAASNSQITKTTRLPAGTPPDTPRSGRTVAVTLRFAADSWVEVYDANGQRLFYDIGKANSSHALKGAPPLRVVLGSAPSVSLRINGKRARVPASAVQDDSAQFMINSSGRIVRAQSDGTASPASTPNGE